MKKTVNIIYLIGILSIMCAVFFIKNTAGESSIPIESSIGIEVSDWPSGTKKEAIYDNLKKDAEKNDYDVYKVVDTLNNEKRLISIRGNALDYKSFNPTVNIVNAKLDSITDETDIRGLYILTNYKNENVKSVFNNLGLVYRAFDNSPTKEYSNIFQYSDMIKTVYVYIVLLISALIFYTFYLFREVAIKITNGYSISRIVFENVIDMLKSTTLYIVLFEFIMVVFLFIYNGWAQLLSYLFIINILFLILLIIFIMISIFSSFLFAFVDVVMAIKGKFNVKIISLISILLKVLITIFITFSVFHTINLSNQIHYLNNFKHSWEKVEGYVTADLSRTYPDEGDAEKEATNKLKKLIYENPDYIVSQNNAGYNFSNNNYDPFEGNVITVNNNYFKYNDVFLENNTKIEPQEIESNSIVIYIPKSEENNVKKLKEQYLEWLNFFGYQKSVHIEYKVIANNQRLFTYNPVDNLELENPVIVNINVNDVNNDFLISAISPGQILFKKDVINSKLGKELMDRSLVTSFTNVNEYALLKYNKIIATLVTTMCILLVSCVSGYIFMFITLKLLITYFEREIFVKVINGWNISRIFKLILILIVFINISIILIALLFMNNVNIVTPIVILSVLTGVDLFMCYVMLKFIVHKKLNSKT